MKKRTLLLLMLCSATAYATNFPVEKKNDSCLKKSLNDFVWVCDLQDHIAQSCPENGLNLNLDEGTLRNTTTYECLALSDVDFENKVNERYQYLLAKAAKKDSAVMPSYFKKIHKEWQQYRDALCTNGFHGSSDVRNPQDYDWDVRKCRIDQAQYYLKSLSRF